jgi:uncharacterized Tic20 family protein
MVENKKKSVVKTNEKQEHTWGMLCHLSALAMFLGIPFGNIIGPLIIWLVKKEEYPFVDAQGKESLNFQISMTIYMAVSGILCIIAIGLVFLFALLIVELVFVILASVKVSEGESYKYPFTIRLIN